MVEPRPGSRAADTAPRRWSLSWRRAQPCPTARLPCRGARAGAPRGSTRPRAAGCRASRAPTPGRGTRRRRPGCRSRVWRRGAGVGRGGGTAQPRGRPTSPRARGGRRRGPPAARRPCGRVDDAEPGGGDPRLGDVDVGLRVRQGVVTEGLVAAQERVDLGDVHPPEQMRVTSAVGPAAVVLAAHPLVDRADRRDGLLGVLDRAEGRRREVVARALQPAPRVALVAAVAGDPGHRHRVQHLRSSDVMPAGNIEASACTRQTGSSGVNHRSPSAPRSAARGPARRRRRPCCAASGRAGAGPAGCLRWGSCSPT